MPELVTPPQEPAIDRIFKDCLPCDEDDAEFSLIPDTETISLCTRVEVIILSNFIALGFSYGKLEGGFSPVILKPVSPSAKGKADLDI